MKSSVSSIRPDIQPAPAKTSTGHVIERGIPIPGLIPFGGKKSIGRPAMLDLSQLEIGDSVLVPGKYKADLVRAKGNAQNAAKRAGIKVVTRTVDGGVRVWRFS